MKRTLLPTILISVGTALFIFCKFVVVKTLCFAYPADHGEWSSFREMLIFAWTHDESPDGVRYELFGPVDFFKDYVYIFCALLVIAGIVLLLRTLRDRSKAGQKKAGGK